MRAVVIACMLTNAILGVLHFKALRDYKLANKEVGKLKIAEVDL